MVESRSHRTASLQRIVTRARRFVVALVTLAIFLAGFDLVHGAAAAVAAPQDAVVLVSADHCGDPDHDGKMAAIDHHCHGCAQWVAPAPTGTGLLMEPGRRFRASPVAVLEGAGPARTTPPPKTLFPPT